MDDPLIWQLLLQVVLIAINAFFASTEIAVISLNANKVRRMAEEGDKKAKQMLKMVEVPAGFLSTDTDWHHARRLSWKRVCGR